MHVFKIVLPTAIDRDIGHFYHASNHHSENNCSSLISPQHVRNCHLFYRLSKYVQDYRYQAAMDIVDTTRHLNMLVPETINRPRVARSWFPVITWIGRSIFGMATQDDINRVLGFMGDALNAQTNALNIQRNQSNLLVSATKLLDTRINQMREFMQTQAQTITTLVNDIQTVAIQSDMIVRAIERVISAQDIHTTTKRHLDILCNAIEEMLAGAITPSLIPPDEITKVIQEIQNELAASHRGATLAVDNAQQVYTLKTFFYYRHQEHLYIVLKLPISFATDHSFLYRIHTTPLEVPSNNSLVSEITNIAHGFIAIGQPDHSGYGKDKNDAKEHGQADVRLNCRQYILVRDIGSILHAEWVYLQDLDSPIYDQYHPSCEHSLFKGDSDNIMSHCRFEVRQEPLSAALVVIDESHLFVRNISTLTIHCENSTYSVPGCASVCTLHIPCGCEVQTDVAWAPPIWTNCRHLQKPSVRHTVNLAILKLLFTPSELENLTTDVLHTEADVILPQIDIFQSKMADMVSSDKTLSFRLNAVANAISNQSTLFRDLADVTAHLKERIDDVGIDDLQSTIFGIRWTDILLYFLTAAVIGCIAMSAYLSTRVKLLLAILAQARPAEPIVLRFGSTPPTNSQITTESLANFDLTDVSAHSIKPYLTVESVVGALQTLALLTIIWLTWQILKRLKRHNDSLSLEFGTATTSICIPMQTLHHVWTQYTITADTRPAHCEVIGWFRPHLSLIWPAITITHSATKTDIKPVLKISLNHCNAFRLRRILKSSYYMHIGVQIDGKMNYLALPEQVCPTNPGNTSADTAVYIHSVDT